MKVTVLYFALLKQARGLPEEVLETSASNITELYSEIQDQHDLGMSLDAIQVAVNEEMVDKNSPLNDGDVVAFLPPMSGG